MVLCGKCHNGNEEASRFCSSCGDPLDAPDRPTETGPPHLSPGPPRDPREVPFYLRWYFIILVFFFLPGWYPIGPIVSVGLWFIRMRALPASRSMLGWSVTLLGLPFLFLSAGIVFFAKNSGFEVFLYGTVLAFSSLWTAAGVMLVLRSRGAKKLFGLIHKQQLRTVDAVAQALGKSDAGAVTADILRVKKRGWLDGYELDSASGEIRYSGAPSGFLDMLGRSKLGAGLLLLAVLFFGIFLMAAPAGTIFRQTTSLAILATDNLGEIFSTEVRACGALPKDDLGRILGVKLLHVESEHRHHWSKCTYFTKEALPSGKSGQTGQRFWIELKHGRGPAAGGYAQRLEEVEEAVGGGIGAGVFGALTGAGLSVPSPSGDVQKTIGGGLLGAAVISTERAKALQKELGPAYRVRDMGDMLVEVRRGETLLLIQSAQAPGWTILFRALGAPKDDSQPSVQQFVSIAKQVLRY